MDGQIAARPVRDEDLDRWEEAAELSAPNIRPDIPNWPMIVKSLVAEIRSLKSGKAKLFVWTRPYRVPYGSSLVFAVAETLEAAKAQAQGGKAYFDGDIEADRVPDVELGDPARIRELPCAEWHAWSE